MDIVTMEGKWEAVMPSVKRWYC